MPCFGILQQRPSGGQNKGNGGCQIGNLRRHWGLDSSSCLAEPFKFILTSFNVSTYCSEVLVAPLFKNSTNKFPHCPTRHWPSLDIQQSACSICSPPFSLQFQFRTTQLPPFWLPERCTLRTPFCIQMTNWNAAHMMSTTAKSFVRPA